MRESRLAPLSGVGFALLLVAAFLVNPNTGFMLPEQDVVAYLEDGPLRIMTGAYLGLIASVFLIWFSASSYKWLRRMDDDEGRLSLLALAGGITAAGLMAVGNLATTAAAERVWSVGAIDAGAAASLFDMASIAMGNGVPLGLGVLIAAWSIVGLRSSGRNRPVDVVGLVIAAGLISPVGWAVLAAALIWVPVAGVWTYRAQSRTSPVVA